MCAPAGFNSRATREAIQGDVLVDLDHREKVKTRLHVARRDAALGKFRPTHSGGIEGRVEMLAQKILGGGLLFFPTLTGGVNQERTVK
jgi:hypothetical protein